MKDVRHTLLRTSALRQYNISKKRIPKEMYMTADQFSLTALGELLIDFTPLKTSGSDAHAHPCFEQNPGGAPANVLACFAKLGGRASFIGAVGRDTFGAFLKQTLDSYGIDTSGLAVKDNANTTLAFVHLAENGDRSFSFYRKQGADTQLSIRDVPPRLIEQADIFHFGSLSLTDEPSRSATLCAVQKAKETGCVISFDPNWRAPLWPSADKAVQAMRESLKYAELVKVSEEEAEMLTGISDPEAAGKALLSETTQVIAVTLGAKGCVYCHRSGSAAVPTFSIPAVDTTGAGDAFWGAFLYRFLELKTPASQLDGAMLRELCTFANAAGTLCASRRGAIPALASRAEIDALIASR